MTDAGYTISDLDMCGCDIMSSPKRKLVLSTILNGFGVQIDGEQICTKATEINFPQKKHALIQAMLSVNDMFFLSRSQVINVFFEDVQLFLIRIIYHMFQMHSFTGLVGYLITLNSRSQQHVKVRRGLLERLMMYHAIRLTQFFFMGRY